MAQLFYETVPKSQAKVGATKVLFFLVSFLIFWIFREGVLGFSRVF